MRIKLNSEACEGHGRCYVLAPALFGADDEGYSVLKVDTDVPPELERDARLAANSCPEFAIEIEER